MQKWKVSYESYGNRFVSHEVVEAMSADEAESKVLRKFRGNDTFDRIVRVEKID
ncbi:hypothetical protein AWB74_00913 [Caballeronia arvi]|uniref:Uncharacterized protein n=1 Tax=Caballeronia arvi TaxID=1777135 RepID=A0A158FSU2_9BURK|nr:hypothetical protein AWB74_00913 [Caballeronia arvi]